METFATEQNVLVKSTDNFIYKFNKIKRLVLTTLNPVIPAFEESGMVLNRTDSKTIQQKHNEVNDSIKYAKRIQDAMMLKERHLFKIFPESFIFNKPKDIVSGDFYWFTRINNKIIIAVADCTGHGIPGAFMSVLGVNLLNQIIIEEQNTNPSSILQRLNYKVKKAFANANDQGENEKYNDGMDISLCCIDYELKTVDFSGAFRPVYHLENNKLHEYKGARFPIGELDVEKESTYESKKFSFKTGDKLYLFSDGFADQFGGVKEKKMLSKKFREILVKINRLSLQTQKLELERILKEWSGNIEQTDDILVLGLKL